MVFESKQRLGCGDNLDAPPSSACFADISARKALYRTIVEPWPAPPSPNFKTGTRRIWMSLHSTMSRAKNSVEIGDVDEVVIDSRLARLIVTSNICLQSDASES